MGRSVKIDKELIQKEVETEMRVRERIDAITNAIAMYIVGHRFLFLVVFSVVTAFLLYEMLHVSIYTNLPDLLPHHPYTQLAKKYEVFGGSNRVLIEVKVKNGDIFNYKTLKKIIDISDESQFIPGVDRNKVYSIGARKIKNFLVSSWGIEFPPLMYPEPPKTKEEMEILKKNIYGNSLYYGGFVSLDSKAALVSAEFFVEGVDYGVVGDHLNEIKKKYGDENTEIYIEGTPYLYAVFKHYLPQTTKLFILTFFAIILLHYLFAKDWRLVFAPVLCMIISAVWGIGAMVLLGINFDPILLVIPILISSRALSHSLQFSWRIHEEFIVTHEIKSAVVNTINGLMYPGLSGIIADAIGIGVIAFVPVPLMYKLGLGFFMWSMGMAVVVLGLNPVIYCYLPEMKGVKEWREKLRGGLLEGVFMKNLAQMTTGRIRKSWLVLGCSLIVLIFGLYFSKDLYVGDVQPGSPLLKSTSQYNKDAKLMNVSFPGLMDPLMIIVDAKGERGITNPDLMVDMAKLHADLMGIPEVMGATSIVDLIKNLNMKLYEDNPKMFITPYEVKGIAENLFFLQGGGSQAGDFDQYYTLDPDSTNLVAFVKDHTAQTVNNVISGAKQCIDNINGKREKKDYQFLLATGRVGLVAATNETVGRDQTLLFVVALVLTGICAALFLQSITAGVLLLIPLTIANFFTFAYMAFAGLGINLQTLPVPTIAVGLGIDYGLYLLSRMREEYRGDLDAAIAESIATAGHATVVCGLIIIISVIFWNFSDIKFQADMGLLFSLVTLFHLLGTMILLPALVKIIKPKFIMARFLS